MAQKLASRKRVKVRLEFPEKLFYENVLTEWKDNISENKNHAYTIKRALINLQKFPLNIHGFSELRKIRGIGEDIATRLDAAWKHACEVHLASQTPTIEQIKNLGRGEPFRILEEASSNGNGRKRNIVPFVPKHRHGAATKQDINRKTPLNGPNNANKISNGPENKQKQATFPSLELPTREGPSNMDYDDPLNLNDDQEMSLPKNDPVSRLIPSTSSGPVPASTQYATRFPAKFLPNSEHEKATSSSSSASQQFSTYPMDFVDDFAKHDKQMLTYIPGQTIGDGRLLLITDNREGIAGNGSKRRKAKGVVEHLASMGMQCENRILSVGDYLWILQWVDWEGRQQEMVLDYIVERKTWDDLKRSIRETRYLEQKSRLRKCGLRNVVLVVEGGFNSDRSLEQAMMSTVVDNDFLVHRTLNMQGTAKFLQHLTKRLDDRWRSEKMMGPSFQSLQENCKKALPRMVSDCWFRQLTVCPGMSIDRAQLIRTRFPTFRSLAEFYKKGISGKPDEDQLLLARELPLVPFSVSKQLYTFFQRALNPHAPL